MGIVFSVLAGLLISLQGVFNARVSEKAGLWETAAIVHGVGFMVSLAVVFWLGNGDFRKITQVNFLYLLGGALGVFIVFSVMRSILTLGPTYSVMLILVTQVLVASVIDGFGLFGCAMAKFNATKFFGIAVMIAGILIFKMKG